MKKTFSFFITLFAAGLIFYSTAMAKTVTPAQKRTMYSNHIDNYISLCNSKAARTNSYCKNIRIAASLHRIKAAFLTAYKDVLIESLMKAHVGTKMHRIHWYLNKEFFRTFREAGRAAHLGPHAVYMSMPYLK